MSAMTQLTDRVRGLQTDGGKLTDGGGCCESVRKNTEANPGTCRDQITERKQSERVKIRWRQGNSRLTGKVKQVREIGLIKQSENTCVGELS